MTGLEIGVFKRRFPRTNPAQKSPGFSLRTTPHKAGLAHNSAQEIQPDISR